MEGEWEVLPAEAIEIQEDKPAEVRVRNRGKEGFAYRIKTNAPTAYTVSPSQGTVEGNSEVIIKISLKPPATPRPKHKFQVLLTPSSASEVQAALLSVNFTIPSPAKPVSEASSFPTASPVTIPAVEDTVFELEETTNKLIALSKRTETLSEEVKSLRMQLATELHRREFGLADRQKTSMCVCCGLYQSLLGLTLGLLISRMI
jgi:hypothetical protein